MVEVEGSLGGGVIKATVVIVEILFRLLAECAAAWFPKLANAVCQSNETVKRDGEHSSASQEIDPGERETEKGV